MTEGGQFIAQIEIKPGATLIQTDAIDVEGGKASDTRAVAAGELRLPGAMVNDAIAVGLSDDALHSIGKAAGTIMAQTDMAPILAPMNPMVNVGLEADGSEDCLYAKVTVKDVDMSKAVIDLEPVAGGLRFSLNLKDLSIPMHARYGASCLDGDTDISVSAADVKVTGILNVTPNGKSFDVKMTEKDVVLTGFRMEASGLPGAVLDILPLDAAAEFIIEQGAEAFMGPIVNDAFGALAGVKTVDVLGKKLDVEVFPSDLYFDPAAAHIVLSTRMKIQGTESSKGFIYTPNATLDLNPAQGFKFGMADDAANQLLAGVAAAGMMNITMPAPGGTFDSTAIAMTLPPMISADPKDGRMQLIAANLSFKRHKPFNEKRLGFGAESPFLRLGVAGWLQLVQPLKHGPCRLFGGCVGPLVKVCEFLVHIRPNSQAKPLQQAVIPRPTCHGIPDIALQLARLHAPQHGQAHTGHIRLPTPNAVNCMALIAVVACQVEAPRSCLPGPVHAAKQAMQFIAVNQCPSRVRRQQVGQLFHGGIVDHVPPGFRLWCGIYRLQQRTRFRRVFGCQSRRLFLARLHGQLCHLAIEFPICMRCLPCFALGGFQSVQWGQGLRQCGRLHHARPAHDHAPQIRHHGPIVPRFGFDH